jgi:heme oxygenase
MSQSPTRPESLEVAAQPAPSLAADLKSETRDQHTRAERHPIQAAIVAGQISRREYARLVAQNRHLHEALEHALDHAATRDPRVATVFAPHHRRLANYDNDLASLGLPDADRAALPHVVAASQWLQGLAQRTPIAVLGALYVIEGSTNGGQFLSRILSKALGVTNTKGLSALDPHADRTRELWAQFRASVDALEVSDIERDQIISTARETFDRMGQIMDDVVGTNA